MAITNPTAIIVTASNVAAIPDTELPVRFGGTELNNSMVIDLGFNNQTTGTFTPVVPKSTPMFVMKTIHHRAHIT